MYYALYITCCFFGPRTVWMFNECSTYCGFQCKNAMPECNMTTCGEGVYIVHSRPSYCLTIQYHPLWFWMVNTQCQPAVWNLIFKYALILQSDSQNGVVIKTYIARLISLPASCVFYVTRQVCLKINTLSHARSWKYGKYSASASHIQLGLRPRWIWDAEALYFSVFHSRLCDNL